MERSSAFGTREHVEGWRVLKGVLEWELFGLPVTTFIGVNNFQDIWAIKLTFVLEMRKILCRFWKYKKNWSNIFVFFDNGAWTCCRNLSVLWGKFMWSQSMCYRTVLRSQIWLREIFSNSILSWINQKLG